MSSNAIPLLADCDGVVISNYNNENMTCRTIMNPSDILRSSIIFFDSNIPTQRYNRSIVIDFIEAKDKLTVIIQACTSSKERHFPINYPMYQRREDCNTLVPLSLPEFNE